MFVVFVVFFLWLTVVVVVAAVAAVVAVVVVVVVCGGGDVDVSDGQQMTEGTTSMKHSHISTCKPKFVQNIQKFNQFLDGRKHTIETKDTKHRKNAVHIRELNTLHSSYMCLNYF